MNKQQLAAKIWESANKMRSKIEASEYKDYILGFMFYKFLSEQQERFLRKEDYDDNDIENLSEENFDDVKYIQDNLGYFISYKNFVGAIVFQYDYICSAKTIKCNGRFI